MKATIMMGLPRSGKSTWIARHYPDAQVVSADHYFMVDGEYRFDSTKLSAAHTACFSRYLCLLRQATPRVVVDNTNTTNWERSPYVAAAQAYEYEVEFVHLDVPAEVCIRRPDNGHGVPDATILGMEARFESLLPWWQPLLKVVREEEEK